MKERRSRWHLIAWWTEVVVQCTRKWSRRERETLVGHEVGRASAMCAPFMSLSGGRKRRGEGVHSMRRHASDHIPKRRKEGGLVWGEGESQEMTRCGEKEGKHTT